MRRLTGTYDGVAVEVLEIGPDQVECPPALRDHLAQPGGRLPTGTELEQACRLLFGETLRVEEI